MLRPSQWITLAPWGLGRQKPHHFREMARVAWENRDQLPFAWRILRDGVCDGCALGTSGLKDWTLDGVHLCMVRLELMRLNTAGPLDPRLLADVSRLRTFDSAALRTLGRLPEPMLRRRGDPGFSPVSWDEAQDLAARHLRQAAPARIAFYLTSRGITNEVYYAAQKVARFLGTNHVDNSARLCHAASTVAMKETLGYGASTCSYADWLRADLIVFFGANTPNNQPVTTKYLHVAKAGGTRIAVVNPFREPGLQGYWVPSIPGSALFGTRLADSWFDVHTGGDLAFLVGTLRALIETGEVDEPFIRERTTGFEAVRRQALDADWPLLERESGAARSDMERFAKLLVERPSAVFVWSMGLTQHAHGVDTVKALVNLALARGLPGRPAGGLTPIRGHSGVQGGAEVGCVPAVDDVAARRWESVWGFGVPATRGLTAGAMVDAAARGEIDVLWMVGGNFLETLADAPRTARGLQSLRLRIHHDIVVSSAMLADADGDVLLLPAATRYESPGGGTETSTERRIIFSPEIAGRRVGSARPEWRVMSEVAALVHPDRAALIRFHDATAIRDEIARAVPLYAGIERLNAKGDEVQWGGRRLYADGRFATPDGKARFVPVAIPERRASIDGRFTVSTRRGKQFNSMVQRPRDPLTGAGRRGVLVSRADMQRLGIDEGAPIRLRSDYGEFLGYAHGSAIKPGNLAVHWPEGNVLLSADRRDPASLEPDYNCEVSVEKASSLGGER